MQYLQNRLNCLCSSLIRRTRSCWDLANVDAWTSHQGKSSLLFIRLQSFPVLLKYSQQTCWRRTKGWRNQKWSWSVLERNRHKLYFQLHFSQLQKYEQQTLHSLCVWIHLHSLRPFWDEKGRVRSSLKKRLLMTRQKICVLRIRLRWMCS